MDNVHNRLGDARLQIELACRRAGRNPAEITLVGAAKTVPSTTLLPYLRAGLRDVGENYVQEGLSKQQEIARLQAEARDEAEAQDRAAEVALRWHLIGSLQSNKARVAVGAFGLIHSVDRTSLAQAIDREAGKRQIVQDVLLQVNLGNETSKAGCAPGELEALMRACALLPNIAIKGLMALPPFSDNPEDSRPHFRYLRELGLQLRPMSTHAGDEWHLSMGMSRDFSVAIEEGATIIRVGTGLFGSRTPKEINENTT